MFAMHIKYKWQYLFGDNKDKSNWFHSHLKFKQIESWAFCLNSKLGKNEKSSAILVRSSFRGKNNVTHGLSPHIRISHGSWLEHILTLEIPVE